MSARLASYISYPVINMNLASELEIKYFILASKPAKAFCLLRYVELPFTTFVESYSGTICFSLSSGETLSSSSMTKIKRNLANGNFFIRDS